MPAVYTRVLLAAASLAACATPDARPREPLAASCYACDELAADPRPAPDAPGGAPLEAAAPPEDRWAVRRLGALGPSGSVTAAGAAEPAAARPRRARRISLELKRAPFDEAARLLAEAGRFNLVVEAPSATDVTVSLHDIEPFDALCAIADVRGLQVRYERGVVLVSP